MKENKWFKVKQRVELHISTESGVLNLSTHIENVEQDGKFIVAAPFYKGQLYPLLAKEQVELLAIVEGIGIVSCDVIVDKRLKKDDIVLLQLERISDITKTQRRRHYRLPTLLETEILVEDRPDLRNVHAVSKDISAGGIRCITPERFFKEEAVHLKVKLDGELLDINSSVLDSHKVTSEGTRFETRFEFKEIEQKQERIIVAFIFDQQRKRRRR